MKKKYHFIGIGGIGMGAIASIMLNKGFIVSGSDVRENYITKGLKEKGADIFVGHNISNIKEVDAVIYSSAVSEDNVELSFSRRQKDIIVMKRAEALAQLMAEYISITISGAHGKTTVTSMIYNMINKAGLCPTVTVGGVVNELSSNADLGKGSYFIAEVDESDGSFLCFYPKYSVITNIDSEHLDYYKNFDNIVAAYQKFIKNTSDDGELIICGDDGILSDIVEKSGKTFIKYGISDKNDIVAKNILLKGLCSYFDCYINGKHMGNFKVNMPGKHNVLNALACISLGNSLSIDIDVIKYSIEKYSGVQRRFQVKFDDDDIIIIDDYAHHPTEIKATLNSANEVLKNRNIDNKLNGRLIAVFQPHRFSRLKYLLDDFSSALINCDKLIITDLYAASEFPIKGIDANLLVETIRNNKDIQVDYLPKDNIIKYLLNIVRRGDMLIMMGAGDITKICDILVDKKISGAIINKI